MCRFKPGPKKQISILYSGLGSSDEAGYYEPGVGRVGPNVEQDYDRWFMTHDALGNVLKGPLPQDRTHYLKAYGSYSFPFGLTVGLVAYGRSGLPLTTKVYYGSKYFYVNNRGDLGRLPFTFWANLYFDYTIKFGKKYQASINLQIDNVTSTSTVQRWVQEADLQSFSGSSYDAKILDGTFAQNYMAIIESLGIEHPMYNHWAARFDPWSARLGFRFSF